MHAEEGDALLQGILRESMSEVSLFFFSSPNLQEI